MTARPIDFEAIGTRWVIDMFEPVTPDTHAAIAQSVQRRIATFDGHYSRFRSDSLVTQMYNAPGDYILPEDAQPMLDTYWRLYQLTAGAVTPLIGELMVQTGYDAQYSLVPKPLTSPPRWEDVVDYQFPRLTTRQPVLFDFGALGKGYLVDLVSEVIESFGVTQYCVDAGGDMRIRSSRPLNIGLEHPTSTDQVIGTIELTKKSLCSSSGNRRRWNEFHHIMDPHERQSVQDVMATWVVAENTVIADAIATALFFIDPEKLQSDFEFEALRLFPNLSVAMTAGFEAQLFQEERSNETLK